MKKASALVEFVLTTAVLGFWAIACVAAFQATTSAPSTGASLTSPTGTASPISHAQALPADAAALTGQPATVEAALDLTPKSPPTAGRI